MIDRALGFGPTTESYYFQLYPVNLILNKQPVPTEDCKFKFSIFKGMQKFDENKITTDANFINTNGTNIMPFRGCQLNFYLPNFNKNRKVLFSLKLNQREGNEDFEVGTVDIDPAPYIEQFKEKTLNRFEQKIQLSDQYTLEFEIYLEKSRFALEKIVKSFKTERSMKSPVRQRKSPIRGAKSPVKEQQSTPKQETSNKFSRNNKRESTNTVQQVETPEEPEPVVEKSRSIKDSKVRETAQFNSANDNVSQKSQSLNEIKVSQRPIKRNVNKDDTEVEFRSSQRRSRLLESEATESNAVSVPAADENHWSNHLQLVIFTVVGLLIIFWVMHPTKRI